MDKRKIILFTVLSWVIVLAAVNFICGRIVGNRYIALDVADGDLSKKIPGYFKPDQDKIILFPGLKEYRVKTNALGFRSVGSFDNSTLNSLTGQYKILALGDSMTFGLYIGDKDTYPYILQESLNREDKNAIVLNAGIGSTTIADHIYYLNKKGLALHPDLVIINFCPNDLEELTGWKGPLYEKMIRENSFSPVKTVKLANFMRVFRKMELAYRYKRWLRKTKDDRTRSILTAGSKKLDDVLYVAAHQYSPEVIADPYQESLKAAWDKYFKAVDEIDDLLKKNNIKFLFFIYPEINTVFDAAPKGNYQDILTAHFKKKKIDYIDLRPIFKKHRQDYLKLYNDPPRDYHLSRYGNSLLVEQIESYLRNVYKNF